MNGSARDGSSRKGLPGTRGTGSATAGTGVASCWRSVPRAATITARAAARITINSAFAILLADRRKTPPG
jgi:hypothetical protein